MSCAGIAHFAIKFLNMVCSMESREKRWWKQKHWKEKSFPLRVHHTDFSAFHPALHRSLLMILKAMSSFPCHLLVLLFFFRLLTPPPPTLLHWSCVSLLEYYMRLGGGSTKRRRRQEEHGKKKKKTQQANECLLGKFCSERRLWPSASQRIVISQKNKKKKKLNPEIVLIFKLKFHFVFKRE